MQNTLKILEEYIADIFKSEGLSELEKLKKFEDLLRKIFEKQGRIERISSQILSDGSLEWTIICKRLGD